jgi:TM2 domain-containing membrane protein YozV
MALAAVPARAQSAEEGEVVLSLSVGYNLMYKEGTWVPVDVIVDNNDRDIDGHVEVRCLTANGIVQSPLNTMPIVQEKGTRGRYRLYCFLNAAARVEARIFHEGDQLDPVPAFLEVKPMPRDYGFALVLDDQPDRYAFTTTAWQEDGPVVRHGVRRGQTALLPDHLACYDAFDLIVMGDIDPRQLPAPIQNHIAEYVAHDGQLVVGLGRHVDAYRDSWVLKLAGVAVGEVREVTEAELANNVFKNASQRNGAQATREGRFVEIVPEAVDRSVGGDWKLLTHTFVGNGRVTVIAVDAEDGLLQRTPGYLQRWAALRDWRPNETLFHRASLLPYRGVLTMASDVALVSKTTVTLYLLLYFLLGFVANGAVCFYLRRPGMVWPVLLVVSLGFTTFAVIFGMAGRAREDRWEQLDVALLAPGSTTAQVHTIAGLLSTRTVERDFELTAPDSLVRDMPTFFTGHNTFFADQRPFTFEQGAEPAVEALEVGASEMRPFILSRTLALPGSISGTLQVRKQLEPVVKLENETGLTLEHVYLRAKGDFWQLHEENGIWSLNGRAPDIEDVHFGPTRTALSYAKSVSYSPGMARFAPRLLGQNSPRGRAGLLGRQPGSLRWPRDDGAVLIAVASRPPLEYFAEDLPVDVERSRFVLIMPLQETRSETSGETP